MPVCVELFQDAGYTHMPPSPIRRILREYITRQSLNERGVLQTVRFRLSRSQIPSAVSRRDSVRGQRLQSSFSS